MRLRGIVVTLLGLRVWITVAPARAEHSSDDVRTHDDTRSARTTQSTSPLDNALRLARLLNDERVIAELLASRAIAAGETQEDLAEVVNAFEALGEPGRARSVLQARLGLFPIEAETWMQLAELLTRMGRASESVDAWRHVEARWTVFGMTTREIDAYARALVLAGQRNEAYRVLKAAQTLAPVDAHDFWDDLGTLAWQRNDAETAALAYRRLRALHDTRGENLHRLMTLAREEGALDEAVSVGIEDFRANGDNSSLLAVAEIQRDREDWAGVTRTLSLFGEDARGFPHDASYWILRGEAADHLGDRVAARAAFEEAVKLDPGSATAKGALMWDAIEREDFAALRVQVERWRVGVEDDPAMWGGYAVALDKLGRVREALPFFAREFQNAPGDPSILLEFSDALERVGDKSLALELRGAAAAKLRESALKTLHRANASAEERSAEERTALLVAAMSGAELGQRWLSALRARRFGNAPDVAALVIESCLSDGSVDCAREQLLGNLNAHAEDPKWRGLRLQLALADDDVDEITSLVVSPAGLSPNDRIDAFTRLEMDGQAADAIREALRAGSGEPGDEIGWRERLAQIRERHEPSARVGATYDYIGGLDAFGPDAMGAGDLSGARTFWSLAGRQMGTRDSSLRLEGEVREVDAFALARFANLRGVTEAGAGANVQPSTPLPRATFFDQRLVTAALGTTVRLGVNDAINDTGLLRLAGVSYIAAAGIRDDFPSAYVQLDVHAREDHTRRLHSIAWEVGESAEVGYKVLRSSPEWDVGVQALALERHNVTTLPSDIAAFVPRSATLDLSEYLPPSYELVSFVTHLSRGDFLQRYRPDRAPYPRYDCIVGAGLLLPDLDGAFEAECAVSLITPLGGYVSATGAYNRGVFGISDQTNASTSLSYTQSF